MENNKVPEVDGIKQLSDVGSVSGDTEKKSGDWPLRLRGYYRALKRGDAWAVKLSKHTDFAFFLRWIYRDLINKEKLTNNPFLALLEKDKGTSSLGAYFPVPIIFKDSDGA